MFCSRSSYSAPRWRLRRRPVLLSILILLLTLIHAIWQQHEMSACWYGSPSTSSHDAASCFLSKLTAIASDGQRGGGQKHHRDKGSHENNKNDDDDQNIRQKNKVPHILYFTYKYNILDIKKPERFYYNIRNTIDLYEKAWSEQENDTQVQFLTDKDCVEFVNRTEPRLLDFYLAEPLGKYKADICRIAALYETGGYYFDVDMQTIKPWNADNGGHENCTFHTAIVSANANLFFQSILVTTARHVVLEKALMVMLEHYQSRKHLIFDEHNLVGPKTLKAAYEMLNYSRVEPQDQCLGEEIKLTDGIYPNISRNCGGPHYNNVVHGAREQEVYFFSRVPGCLKIKKMTVAKAER